MTEPRRDVVIVDIDGTLADVQHRLHHIKGSGKKNWKQFFRSAPQDEPIDIIFRWVNNLAPDYTAILITGRPDEYRKDTEAWLAKHGVRYSKLYMRRAGDHRPDTVVKQELLDKVGRERVAFVIDDRPQVCDMYRGCGMRVFQVSSGESY
jgi:phosphoglycolate phosphatase-like HAD superfamily hydrolase